MDIKRSGGRKSRGRIEEVKKRSEIGRKDRKREIKWAKEGRIRKGKRARKSQYQVTPGGGLFRRILNCVKIRRKDKRSARIVCLLPVCLSVCPSLRLLPVHTFVCLILWIDTRARAGTRRYERSESVSVSACPCVFRVLRVCMCVYACVSLCTSLCICVCV